MGVGSEQAHKMQVQNMDGDSGDIQNVGIGSGVQLFMNICIYCIYIYLLLG